MGPTTTPATYTRAIRIDVDELAAGDLIDMAAFPHISGPMWVTVTGVGTLKCDDDELNLDRDEPCEGTCHTVISTDDDGVESTIHVQHDDNPFFLARIRTGATADEVTAESEASFATYQAHLAAQAAR